MNNFTMHNNKIKSKKLRILFLYPNLNMTTLVPNAISILTAVLKKAGFKNIDLFDTTFYETDALNRMKYQVKVGQIKPYNYNERDIKLKKTDMFKDFVDKINKFNPDIIFASIVEDTFPIFIKFIKIG